MISLTLKSFTFTVLSVFLLCQTIDSAKRRIDNVVDRKASGSRVFSAAATAAVVIVSEAEAEANANGVVVVDDDKNLNSDGG